MNKLTRENVQGVLTEHGLAELKIFLEDAHPADIALLIEELDEREQLLTYRVLRKDVAAEAFSQMSLTDQTKIFDALDEFEEKELFERLETDDAVDFLEELPANMVRRLLRACSPERRTVLNHFLNYAPESAGSVMTDIPLIFNVDMSVGEALQRLREDRTTAITFGTLYVTSEDRILLGVLSLRELLHSQDEALLKDVMQTNVISVHTNEDQQEASLLIMHYDFQALPVTDSENRLVGVITVDDAMDILELEASEDMELIAGVQPQEVTYRELSAWEQAKRRIPWMSILMVSGLFNGVILGQFEAAFVALPILVTFIPMLTDTGGNAGSQTTTLIIRGLATQNLTRKDLKMVLWKELKTAVLVSMPLIILVIIRSLFIEPYDAWIGVVTGLAMACIIVMSKLLGALLPMLSERIGIDPALMAGPVITTVVDALGLVIYFGLAILFLGL